MNFDFNFTSSTNSSSDESASPALIDQYDKQNEANNTFECFMNGSGGNETNLNVDAIANDNAEEMLGKSRGYALVNNMQNLYMQNHSQSKFNNKNIPYNLNSNVASYMTSDKARCSTNYIDSINKFQYVLMAPTSPAVKFNEDSLTYLNQGQNYELKLNKLQPVKMQVQTNQTYMEDIKPLLIDQKICSDNFKDILTENPTDTLNQIVCGAAQHDSPQMNMDKMLLQELNDPQSPMSNVNGSQDPVYLSIIRLCFWDRKLQEIEHEEIKEWEKEYYNVRMLEIDNTSSFGTIDVRVSEVFTNAAEVLWYGKTGANIFFRCNCTSTAFAPHKHGGEKGIHMRLQIDTFELAPGSEHVSPSSPSSYKTRRDDLDCITASSPLSTQLDPFNQYWKHMCSSFCRIQLFRLKGAQRKLKTDKLKIERLNPPDLKKRYQPSTKVTVLYNTQYDSLYSLMPFTRYLEPMGGSIQLSTDSNLDSLFDNDPKVIGNLANLNSFYLNNFSSSGSTSSLSSSSSSSGSSVSSSSMVFNGPSYNNQSFIQPLKPAMESSSTHSDPIDASSQSYLIENNAYVPKNMCKEDLIKANNRITTNNSNNMPDSSGLIASNISGENSNSVINTFGEELVSNPLKRQSSINNSINDIYAPSGSNGLSNIFNNQNQFSYKNTKIQKTNSPVTSQTGNNKDIWSTTPSLNQQTSKYSSQSSITSISLPSSPHSPITSTSNSSALQHQLSVTNSFPSIPIQKSNYYNSSDLTKEPTTSSITSSLSKDCSSKLVQEWLVLHRFNHLTQLFSNYTSNDLLCLSKEDMISLCGAPDGIRCFNVAHNIQMKPKLTVFVTFKTQSYFSAIFMAEWKNNSLTKKLVELYKAFVEKESIEIKDREFLQENCMHEFELFLKLKDILVEATDDLLNNLEDQSKYMIEFEVVKSMNSIELNEDVVAGSCSQRRRLVKVVLLPID